MARRTTGLGVNSVVATVANRWQNLRTINESSSNPSHDEQRAQISVDRQRILSAKAERCVQELVERVYKRNSAFKFELLAPPPTHVSLYLPNENKEFYFDFYLVWKNPGEIQVERDISSVCCKIRSLNHPKKWSRAEEDRLLITNVTRKKISYLNGRGLRDLFFETLHEISPDLLRLDFLEHLIYFDLIVPTLSEKSTCHITLLPCLHLPTENEVLLPFGTLRWYPRSLLTSNEKSLSLPFQQPLQNLSIRRYISTTDTIDETTKLTKKDQQEFARIRAILHELFLPSTLEHVDCIEQIQEPFETDEKTRFFLPHRTDRNCDVFPIGEHLLKDAKAKRFFQEFLKANIKVPTDVPIENSEPTVAVVEPV